MLRKLLVVLVILLGFLLRLHDYNVYPQRGASSDEYAFAFVGVSLFTKGIPIGWSAFDSYKPKNRSDLTINKIYFPLVKPYFDHPPLYGLLIGGWSVLNGQNTFEKIDLKTIRLIPVFLSVVTMLFLFLLANNLFGYKTALFALLIDATTTLFVVSERAVFAENLITPLFLATLYLYTVFERKFSNKKIVVLSVLCGLAFLTKIAGIVVFVSILFLMLTKRDQLKSIGLFIVIFLLFVVGFIAYGYYFDANLFWSVTLHQSNRAVGPATLLYLLSTPIIVNKVYLDGWYFLGLISIFVTFVDYKKYNMIFVPSFFYILFLLATLTQKGEMGWYMIPLYPFMAISIAVLFVESLKNKSWYVFLMLLFVGTYMIHYLFEQNFGLSPFGFRAFLIIACAPLLIAMIFRKEKAFSYLAQFWFYVFIGLNILLSYSYIHPA